MSAARPARPGRACELAERLGHGRVPEQHRVVRGRAALRVLLVEPRQGSLRALVLDLGTARNMS